MKIFKTTDPVGSIFLTNGGIYRGINDSYIKQTKKILESCQKSERLKSLLLNTKEVDSKNFSQFYYVLEHEKIDPFTYPSEWSSAMIYDAAYMVIDLMLELDQIGLGIKDAHIFNVGYHQGKFVWIDFGALTFKHENHNFLNAFRDSFINSLIILLGVIGRNYQIF